jgi:hypothetical protein
MELLEEKEAEDSDESETKQEPADGGDVTPRLWESMQPQDAADVRAMASKTESSSSNWDPTAPLMTPDTGVVIEPTSPKPAASSSSAGTPAKAGPDLWANYGRNKSAKHARNSAQDSDMGGLRQRTNALNLEPCRSRVQHPAPGRNAWQTPVTNDVDAQWELHRDSRAAPSNPVEPDYYAEVHGDRSGSVAWNSDSWRGNDHLTAAGRRWNEGPYGSYRARGRGRGGQW